MSYLIDRQDRGFSGNPWDAPDRTYSLDTLPQEYPFLGSGDYRETCLEQKDACGALAADYRYASHRILSEKPKLSGLPMLRGGEDVETLEITMEDAASQTALILQYSVYACADILTRSAKIINRSTVPIRMERALSCCVDFCVPERFELMTFYGRHCGERTMQRTPVVHGKTRIDSIRGVSSRSIIRLRFSARRKRRNAAVAATASALFTAGTSCSRSRRTRSIRRAW